MNFNVGKYIPQIRYQIRYQIQYYKSEQSNIIFSKTIYIFTRIFTNFFAEMLEKYFNNLNIKTILFRRDITNVEIIECIYNPNIYIFLISPHIILHLSNISSIANTRHPLLELPKNKYILYQIEQYNQQNIPKLNEKIIENCHTIFDYSNINLQYYPLYLRKRVKILVPLIVNPRLYLNNKKTIDILFIGSINERRDKILNNIKKYSLLNHLNYNIKIVSDKSGTELINIIQQSRIILNLHSYQNSLFEVFRIHDVLPYNIKIISEKSANNEEKYLIKKYKNVISFCPIVNNKFSNISNLYQLINENLKKEIDVEERKNFINSINVENSFSLNLTL